MVYRIVFFAIVISLVVYIKYRDQSTINRLNNELKKTRQYYTLLNIWFSQLQEGKSVVPYMLEKNYKNVAIYGMAELGERLYYELVNGGINVVYVMDMNPYVYGEFNYIKPGNKAPNVDVVIVTAEYYIDKIEKIINKDSDNKIITLSTLLGNAFKMNW